MPLLNRASLFFAVVAGVGACGEGRVAVPVVTLPATPDTLVAPFTLVTAAAALGEGRWAVLAPDQELVAIVDFRAGSVDTLGGGRHRAYRNPLTVFAAHDALYVSDWGLRRVTVWDRAGRLTDSFPAFASLRGAMPTAADRQGSLYSKVPPRGRTAAFDSAAVVRTPPDGSMPDTVAALAPLDMVEVSGERGSRLERRILSGEDVWGVRPDGAVWVARVRENRVSWFTTDGRRRDGPLLPDRVLPVTQRDRDQFLEEFPPALRSTARKLPFAAIKPAFVAGMTAGDGTVWLERSRAEADTAQQYQVIDSIGQLIRTVHIPGWGRLRAVGSDAALVAEPLNGRVLLLQFGLGAGSAEPNVP